MIFTTPGVVLSRKYAREWDRWVQIYTRDLGRVSVRFVGANRPRGKLKAISEPLAHGEFRLYLRAGFPQAKAVGGAMLSSFPSIRGDWRRTCKALHFCELLLKLTPEHQPSLLKYQLMTETLGFLECQDSKWLAPAFGLRLLDLAGFSLRHQPPENLDPEVWERLHGASLSELDPIGLHPEVCKRVESRVIGEIEKHLEAPLKTTGSLWLQPVS